MEITIGIVAAFIVFGIGIAVGRTMEASERELFKPVFDPYKSEVEMLRIQLAAREDELRIVRRNYEVMCGRECQKSPCYCTGHTIVKRVYADSKPTQDIIDLVQGIRISPELDELKKKLGL